MSYWAERFNQHAIHNTLRTLQNFLNETSVDLFKGQESAFASYERIKQVYELVKLRLDSTDPNLVPLPTLNNLNSSFQAVVNEISAFKANKNIAHLTNANNHIENILAYISTVHVPLTSRDMEGIKEAVSSYRRSIGKYIRNIEEENSAVKKNVSKLTNDINALSSEISTQKQRVDSIISSFQQQFSTAEEKRRSEFQAAESERRKTSDNLLNQKETEWNQIIKENQKEYEALLLQTTKALEKLEQDSRSKTNEILADTDSSRNKAQELVGIITDTGMVGGYQRVANQEKQSAKNWRKVAVWSLVALVAFAIFAFVETLGVQIRWDQFAARIFVATSFGILAAYSALQADKHEKSERKNRKTELELASISPYLYDLPEDKRHKIREELAMRMFGQAETNDIKIDKKTSGSVLDILRIAVETIGNLAKK